MRLAPLLLVVGACDLYVGPDREPPQIQRDAPAPLDARTAPPPTDAVDLLFVLDSAPGTQDVQTLFARSLPALVARLDVLPGGRPSLHIGVTTTSVSTGSTSFGASCATGDDGLLQDGAGAACGLASGRYLFDVPQPDGGRWFNYPPPESLGDALQCIAGVGADGCAFVAPLEAMKRALDGSQPGNAGFLRDGAALVVVVITQDDDCSADPTLFAQPLEQAGPGILRCAVSGYACDQPISPTEPGKYTGCAPRTGGPLHDVAGYVDFLTSLRDPARLGFFVIEGPAGETIMTGTSETSELAVLPSCVATIDGNYAPARPADRLHDFGVRLWGLGAHAAERVLCTGEESSYMADLAGMIGDAMR